MITDKPPRKPELKDEFARSEAMRVLELPRAKSLQRCAAEIEFGLGREDRKHIEDASKELSSVVAEFFRVKAPTVRVLGARPLEENGDRVDELYGDYTFKTQNIRLWMRTAVLEKPTSFGTYLSTLCHEICHHLDVVCFDCPNTYHTRGFYERAGLLYHHAKGSPFRPLVWDAQKNGTYRINWPLTMGRGKQATGSSVT